MATTWQRSAFLPSGGPSVPTHLDADQRETEPRASLGGGDPGHGNHRVNR